MKRLKLSSQMVVPLSGILCVVLVSCDRSVPQPTEAEMIQRANQFLSVAKLPTIPENATDVHFWAGGAFAKYVNLKFSVSPEEALEYFRGTGAKCYFEFSWAYGRHHVSTVHFLNGPVDDVAKPDLSDLSDGGGMMVQPWFENVYKIGHGWYYTSQQGVAGFRLYYDLDTQQLYTYWWYS